MERKVKVVCSVVGFLGILSALLGFFAEALRLSDSEFVSRTHCAYGSALSWLLGLIGVVVLVISQIILNVSAGCICCTKSPRFPDSNWGVAVISFILSWLTCVSAILLWLIGVMFGNFSCYGLRAGVFAGGAVLALANSAFGIVYYLTLIASGKNGRNPILGVEEGIAMGQAQIPPINQDPIFVHEDTHMRRQFT